MGYRLKESMDVLLIMTCSYIDIYFHLLNQITENMKFRDISIRKRFSPENPEKKSVDPGENLMTRPRHANLIIKFAWPNGSDCMGRGHLGP